ncbi:hypothetical protein J5N97_008725 [Dioscorea zingiberensis]|uniref:Galectin domain-containing protein n=1 Tax=Dioscorea zingiberensis TaxID=325984 RepID=A0A9D5CY58_9LILI|nr:hypothetical protein J5N97_008725 [Dioscorea zingiberensis]
MNIEILRGLKNHLGSGKPSLATGSPKPTAEAAPISAGFTITMKRARSAEALGLRRWLWRWRASHLLLGAVALYYLFISSKLSHLLDLRPFADLDPPASPLVGSVQRQESLQGRLDDHLVRRARYGRLTAEILRRDRGTPRGNSSELDRMAREAWTLGLKAWDDISADDGAVDLNSSSLVGETNVPCPSSVTMGGVGGETMMFLPCGMAVGTAVTVVGTPKAGHREYVPQLMRLRGGNGVVMVSQFAVELQGLKAVDGEEAPKILHFNPRLKGDWSQMPVIEHNTCYRMQWGKAMRCDGLPSNDDDYTVDGFCKCEKWERSDSVDSKESKSTSWLNRFIGRAKKPDMKWPFPFVEGKLFVLTLQAGVEGYHIYVGGRHVSSFPYRTGFALEDATGLSIKGDVYTHSVYATSLPKSHPSFSLQEVLEMSEQWKSDPLPKRPIYLFIGILSASNHFAERMAIRKTWMQSPQIKSGNVVARFFVALNTRKEVNAVLKKEADYFGDLVVLPFMDRYELVVLKTIAICEYGVQNLTAAYIMKCDDDTFISLDAVLQEVEHIVPKRSLYMGNLNLLHRPLRSGKWAVTFEEWPEEVYPPYANGPGYVISSDIANFIVSQHANESLRLFKMEDVSMGMWVEQFNATTPVQYSHNWKFCQYGCMENYYTAHYQSPRQMMCLWDKLARGRAQCCNFR